MNPLTLYLASFPLMTAIDSFAGASIFWCGKTRVFRMGDYLQISLNIHREPSEKHLAGRLNSVLYVITIFIRRRRHFICSFAFILTALYAAICIKYTETRFPSPCNHDHAGIE